MKTRARALSILAIAMSASLCSFAAQFDFANPEFVATRIGCGEIISLRESTQKPLPNDIVAAFYPETTRSAPSSSSTGGQVFQVLGAVPGVGFAARAAADIAVGAVAANARDRSQAETKQREETTQRYEDVMAVEVRLDSGEVINIPATVISGTRMRVGRRVMAYHRKESDSVQLSFPLLFGGVLNAADKDDADYQARCSRNLDPAVATAVLERARTMVDESMIKNAALRRPAE